MTKETATLLAAGAVAGALIAWDLCVGNQKMTRGSASRHVTGQSVRGSALDAAVGQVTPDHLLWFGPSMRPPGWVPHRVQYPAWPGENLELLINGAPMACVTRVVPRAQRAWMFAPPSEVDL